MCAKENNSLGDLIALEFKKVYHACSLVVSCNKNASSQQLLLFIDALNNYEKENKVSSKEEDC